MCRAGPNKRELHLSIVLEKKGLDLDPWARALLLFAAGPRVGTRGLSWKKKRRRRMGPMAIILGHTTSLRFFEGEPQRGICMTCSSVLAGSKM